MEIVLGFLSSGGGKADKVLGDYIDKTLKMKRRHFSQKVSPWSWILGNSKIDAASNLDKEFLSAETHSILVGDDCSGASQEDVAREAGAIPYNPQGIPM